MASTIYKFFDFLEKKTGNTLSPEKNFNMKLKHAKELISDKEIDALPLETKILYYPERLSKEDLTIDGDFTIPRGVLEIPSGLVVKGKLRVPTSINKITDNVQAQSVEWKASSDYYPKSFNGATFTEFTVSWNKDATKFPENIKVTHFLRLFKSNITALPEGLKLIEVNAQDCAQLKTLPSNLECDELDIINTGITEIPQGVIVHKELEISQLPKKYPQHLENVIAIAGGATIGRLKEFEKLPQIEVNVGNRVKKGKGMAVPLADINNKQFFEVLSKYKGKYSEDSDIERNLRKVVRLAEGAGKVFNVKFATVYAFISHKQGFDTEFVLQGKDTSNREIIATPDAVISSEGQASTKTYNYTWSPTERQLKDAMTKLFPKSYQGQKPVKAVNIRTLMTGPQSKEVYWRIGRKTRGGEGIQGKAKDLIPSLSGASQDNMINYANKYKITWGDMMVFDNAGSINIIARSNEKTKDGKYVYFDKYGYGAGGGSKTFEDVDYTVST